jgi:ADP-dependent NAD(P)H-hydrate dehydratase
MDEESPLPKLPDRDDDSHKGDFGRALLIGGSRGMAGAISLSGMSALRSGAGLVRLAVPDVILETVARFEPSYMTLPLPSDSSGRITLAAREPLVDALKTATVVAVGPGMGRSDDVQELVAWLYQTLDKPLVVDADGLNALAARPEVLNSPAGPRVFTPHPGEFARLLGVETFAAEERAKLAREFALRTGAVVLLKGHQTVITDGRQLAFNTTGNPGMATGGMGDVLTGVITAMLCQGLSPFDAARFAAHVHGTAGDFAASEIGPVGMIARDLLRRLPRAIYAARPVPENDVPF